MKMLGERFLTSVRNDNKVNASVISNVVRDLSLLLFSKEGTKNTKFLLLHPPPHAGEERGGGKHKIPKKLCFGFFIFGFRNSVLRFVSDFEVRISDLD
jgi:hypothetical protein